MSGKRIAVLGLTFKPETDDMRDAPSLAILPALLDKGAEISAHDPQGMDVALPLLPGGIFYCDDIDSAINGADAVVLMTEWNQFRGLDLVHLRGLMHGKVFVDLRNVYERDAMREAGFEYHCVGR